MDFEAALKLLKAFSACNLRIYKQFAGFPESGSQESDGKYVVFIKASLAKEPCYCELRDFAESHNLNITPFEQYLMVSGK
jgi:hypothetical protein